MLMRSDISHTSLAILERFTVLLYDRMNGEWCQKTIIRSEIQKHG
jgi:hypothetical protein